GTSAELVMLVGAGWAALCWAALCWAALCWAALCWDGAWGAALGVGSCAGGWPAGDPFWAPVASARSREATTVRRRTGRASGAPVAVDSFELAALESAAGPDVVAAPAPATPRPEERR